MARVVVTGASGRLGRLLMQQLAAQRLTPVPAGRANGFDLTTGAGFERVLTGADAVVHAASDPRHPKAVDVEGTARLAAAAHAHGVHHFVYVSIVGVDRTPFGYYRAKRAAEESIRGSGVPFSIVRSTQWFEFVAQIAGGLARFGLAPRDWVLAPADAGEFATLLTRRVLNGPIGAVAEFGGRERVRLTRAARDIGGHRVLHLGVPGRLSAAVRGGALLPGQNATLGARSWTDWLAAQ